MLRALTSEQAEESLWIDVHRLVRHDYVNLEEGRALVRSALDWLSVLEQRGGFSKGERFLLGLRERLLRLAPQRRD